MASKLADGRVEFALRRLLSDGTWTGSLRPRARFFPTTARLDRWLQSSPISLLTTRPASPTPTTPPPGYTAVPGTPNPTPVLTPRFVSVTTGGDFAVDRGEDGKVAFLGFSRHTCAVRTDHTVTCWGNNDDGHIDVPTSWTNPQVCCTAPTVMIA